VISHCFLKHLNPLRTGQSAWERTATKMESRECALLIGLIIVQLITCSFTTSRTLQKQVDYLEEQQEFKFAELEDSIGDIRDQLKLLNTSDNVCRCINNDQGQGPLEPVVQTHNFVKLETLLKHRNAILQEAFKNEKTAIKDHIQKFDQRIGSELNNIYQKVDSAVEYVQRINAITINLKSNLDRTDASVAKLTERLRSEQNNITRRVDAAVDYAKRLNDSFTVNLKSNLERIDASVAKLTERHRSEQNNINQRVDVSVAKLTQQLKRMDDEIKENKRNVVSLTNQVASMKENLNAFFGCISPWKLVDGLCLRKLSQSNPTFDVAQKKCNSLGGKLAEPTTWAQVQALRREAGSERFLIGVVRSGNGWVRSSDLERQSPDLDWRNGEPNNKGWNEDCVEVLSTGYNDNLCSGRSDGTTFRALCEKRFVNL